MCTQITSQITINASNPLYRECAQYAEMGGATAQLEERVETLEDAAHLPNESFLINE